MKKKSKTRRSRPDPNFAKHTIVRHTITIDISVENLSELLHRSRLDAGLGISQVAEGIGRSPETWKEYISGPKSTIPLNILIAAEKTLGCNLGLDWNLWKPESSLTQKNDHKAIVLKKPKANSDLALDEAKTDQA